jgi:2-polyprenyl-6-hydroxyphenyl methylase / 3-demethylubiquinone-9 3-methyltransferase
MSAKPAQDSSGEARTVSIDPGELAKFQAMAAEWWDPNGKFKPLHRFNPTRLAFIRDRIAAQFGRDPASRRPLEGLTVLDVGCGGGLVCEPMARLGAKVTGVDAGEKNIKTAMAHAAETGVKVDYRVGTVEALLEAGEGPFDVVLNLEVVEHVANPGRFLQDSAALVKPGGMMIVATINRTMKANALAIIMAERVLRWLPVGTHEYDKLVTPAEVEAALRAASLTVQGPFGVNYNPLIDRWSFGMDADVNYMMVGYAGGAA